MTFKRQHCELIAADLRAALERCDDAPTKVKREAERRGVYSCINRIASTLHETMGLDNNGNRRFNRDRFMVACGMYADD